MDDMGGEGPPPPHRLLSLTSGCGGGDTALHLPVGYRPRFLPPGRRADDRPPELAPTGVVKDGAISLWLSLLHNDVVVEPGIIEAAQWQSKHLNHRPIKTQAWLLMSCKLVVRYY